MRVLILPKEYPSPEHPGAGIFIRRRTHALSQLGYTCEVVRIVPHAPPLGRKWNAYRAVPEYEVVDGIPVRTIRAIFPPRMIAMEYLALQVQNAIAREIRRFDPDLIHASFLIPCGQIAVRQSLPTVVTAHGGDAYAWPQLRGGLMRAAREAVSRAGRVTAVSGYIAEHVKRIHDRDVDVIWNGADERFFFPRERAEMRVRSDLPAERSVIAFAGNLLRAKGVYELLEAAASLRDLDPLLVFAGTGPEDAPLRTHASQLNVDARFVGRLDSNRLGELFSAADVVTLPSHAEGLPNVVCEAMLNGNAIVASTAGGTPEIVRDGDSGLLVPPGDTRALAAALRRILVDRALRERLARTARAFAAEHLTWRISALGYDRVYREAVNARGSAPPSTRLRMRSA